MKNLKIGIFDSGVGGFSVIGKLLKALPHNDMIYFGDTLRVPYGTKSPSDIIACSAEIAQFLIEHKCDIVVIACNTITAIAMPTLQASFSTPFFGVINANVEKALSNDPKNILVFATLATVNNGIYQRKLQEKNTHNRFYVYAQECTKLVPEIEKGCLSGDILDKLVQDYFAPYQDKNIDTLVLGCTHYPLISRTIQKNIPSYVTLIDPAEVIAQQLIMYPNINNDQTHQRHVEFYCTGDLHQFTQLKEMMSFPGHCYHHQF